jgi:hypothetical protein
MGTPYAPLSLPPALACADGAGLARVGPQAGLGREGEAGVRVAVWCVSPQRTAATQLPGLPNAQLVDTPCECVGGEGE